jgi:hypothetical protein
MKVLSIGNSFSDDAHRYIYEIAQQEGVEVLTTNLFIGGCTLETHYNNLINNYENYLVVINGRPTNKFTSIKDALLSDKWDVVTLQQASHLSFNYDSYIPYINFLADTIRKLSPNSKIYIHETWPYEDNSMMLKNVNLSSTKEMYTSLHNCYLNALKDVKADKIIPSGTAMYKAYELGYKIHRDTYHASLGFGRYLIALMWLKSLINLDITNNSFNSLDEDISDIERVAAIKIVKSLK